MTKWEGGWSIPPTLAGNSKNSVSQLIAQQKHRKTIIQRWDIWATQIQIIQTRDGWRVSEPEGLGKAFPSPCQLELSGVTDYSRPGLFVVPGAFSQG